MEDSLNFLLMEDDPNYFQMEINLNIVVLLGEDTKIVKIWWPGLEI